MDQLLNMGFTREIASQALAATGGKSTLKATEWILSHRCSSSDALLSKLPQQHPPSPPPQEQHHYHQQQQQQNQELQKQHPQLPIQRQNLQQSRQQNQHHHQEQQQQQIRVDRFFGNIAPRSISRPSLAPTKTAVGGGESLASTETRAFLDSADGKCGFVAADNRSQRGKSVEEGANLASIRIVEEAQGGAGGEQRAGRNASSSINELSADQFSEPRDTIASAQAKFSKAFHPLFSPAAVPYAKRRRPEEQPESHAKLAPAVPAAPLSATRKNKTPLAERMRPVSVDEIVGQDHLLGPGCILRSLLENDTVPSVIFWGPPGTGKTSLARAISRSVSHRFVSVSAVTSGVKEVREVLEEAKRLRKMGQHTLFFVDEVHRFNKAQQDSFLHSVEAGHVVLIGATTENPSFEVNGALLSRCRVLTLNKLQLDDVKKLLERAIADRERGVMLPYAEDPSVKQIKVEEEALLFLSGSADGDARVALNALEIAVAAAVSREKQRVKAVHDIGTPGKGLGDRAVESLQTKRESPILSSKEWQKQGAPGSSLKRELSLKLSALKESLPPSQEEYTRPFKKFVGGKEVTSHGLNKEKDTIYEVREAEGSLKAIDSGVLLGTKDACLPLSSIENRDRLESSKYTGATETGQEDGLILVRFADIREALQRSHLFYDKTGEEHYNIISALHKSMRGGDPDAAMYWLARMLEGGEGPLYIARRLVRFASEDVGLGDPQALLQAVACYQSCHFLGMPECNVHLAQCVAYLSLAPKSVAVYQAIEEAQRVVKEIGQNEPVPLHLRNAPTSLMNQLGYGKGYIYPPSRDGPVEQEYLPPSLKGYKFLKWP